MRAKNLIWLAIAILLIIIGSVIYTRITNKPMITEGLRGPQESLTEQVYLAPTNLFPLYDYLPGEFRSLIDTSKFMPFEKTAIFDESSIRRYDNELDEAYDLSSGIARPEQLSDLDIEYSIYRWAYHDADSQKAIIITANFSPENFQHWYFSNCPIDSMAINMNLMDRNILQQIPKSARMGEIDSISEDGAIFPSFDVPLVHGHEFTFYRTIDAKVDTLDSLLYRDSLYDFSVSDSNIIMSKYRIIWHSVSDTFHIPLGIKLYADIVDDTISYKISPKEKKRFLKTGDHFRMNEFGN
ncbi:MAG: hypothetical protein ACLFSQ_11880 [Candidatus Zixiibacteriota bacterium]